jgi:hypothetical protein
MTKRRWWRWTKRIVLGTVAFVVLAIAITIGTLHTSWGRNRLRLIVEDQLKSEFPGSTIGRVDGSVLGDLILRDVTIMGRNKRPFITVEKVTLEAALLPLAGKTARVDKIAVENVVVYVRDQGPQPPEKPKPARSGPNEPPSWSVELPTIAVDGGRVELETASGTETIDKLAANVSLSLHAGEPMIATVVAGAQWRGKPISINAAVRNGDQLDVMYALASLGEARVVALDAHVDGTKIAGVIAAHAPAALAKQVADVELPGDATVLARMTRTGALELDATVGSASARVLAHVDLETLTAHAIVATDVADLVTVTGGAAQGSGTLVATVIANPEHVDGMVAIAGDAQGYAGSIMVGAQATLDKATIVAAGAGVGWRFGASADVSGVGDTWTLTRSHVVARAHDLAPMRGEVTASVSATGQLAPAPSLAVTGTVDGRAVRYNDLSIARARTTFAASDLPRRPTGKAQIDVGGIKQGTLVIRDASLGARGVMHEDGVIEVDLDRHRVRTADGMVWTGTGGHVRVTETSIAATRLATTSGPSKLSAQATIGRTTDALTAKASARDVNIALFDPTLAGMLGADIDVTRKGGLWTGTATVDARQVVLPKRPVLDGKLAVTIDKRRVTAVATASNPAIGSATLDFDVTGPKDITDVVAWKRLERSALTRIRVALSKIDASKLGASGKLDGELAIGALDAGGKVDVRGVVTEVGTIDSQLALAPGPKGEIAAHGTLHLGGVDPVDVHAVLALPLHPFDPAGWETLGRETLRAATIEAKRLAFDPALLARFGVEDSPWRGWAAVKITVGPAARSSDFVVDIHELRDGPITKPLDIHIAGTSDAAGPRFDATIKSDKVAVTLAGKSPLSVEAMLQGNARKAPIEATLTVPPSAAREVALLIGRDDVLAGTIGGTVTVGGTIEAPTARAQLAVDNLSVAAGIATKPPTLEKLEVDARVDRRLGGVKTGFELEITGHETGGRLLKISARGQPESPESVVATIEASNFDIAPFVAFAPPTSMLIGTRGLVSGVLKLKGLDPNTGDVRGRLVVNNARIPLSPELGNLRAGTFEIDVVKKTVVTSIDAKLGRGTVKGKATLRLTGSMPTTAELTLALRKVSMIGEIQPVIDADITGLFTVRKTKWYGDIVVANGNVFVPPEGGNELITAGAPGDIVFIDKQQILVKPKRRAPTAPWLIASVDVRPMKIVVDDLDFKFNGVASGKLKLELGSSIGLDGTLATERGNVDVLGRRYRLDHGVVDFDGTLDPRLDIRMMHDFRSLTLTVDILGRSSEPDLRLSADAGGYSQGQLLAFLAGATPSDDPAAAGGDALAGGGLTMLSSRLGRRLNEKVSFIKFDTINYEAKTASSSRAIRIGKRIGEHTYLNFRNRFEARPDENSKEATVEHELNRNWLFELAGGERGAGGDLLFRKRW